MNLIYLHLALVAALLGFAAGASDRNPEQFTPNQANWKTFESKPFADSRNPTRAEVDEWHRIAINHVRALVGYTGADREVKRTTACSSAHCGATFLPDASDQSPYLPAGHATCKAQQGAEGVFSASKSNIPWSIKWSRSLCAKWTGKLMPNLYKKP